MPFLRKNQTLIGIDPGATGALAVIQDQKLIRIEDMPVRKEQHTKKMKTVMDIEGIRALMLTYNPDYVYLEEVGYRPGDGGVGLATFMEGFGIIKGIVGALRFPLRSVYPQTWKRAMLCPADKNLARRRACALFPEHVNLFSRVKDHGRAEAALIALYGQREQNTFSVSGVGL